MLVLQSVLLSVGIEVLGYAKDVVQRYLGHGQTSAPVEEERIIEILTQKTCNSTLDELGLRFWPPLYIQRYTVIEDILKHPIWNGSIKKVVEFGCAELSLFKHLKPISELNNIMFVDVDFNILDMNLSKVVPTNNDYLSTRNEPLTVDIYNGSIADLDDRLLGADAVISIELIEHLYSEVLDAVPRTVFEFIKPKLAVFTTPNVEFNVLFPNFSTQFRHDDHKFEWNRKQLKEWAGKIISRYPDYSVQFDGIGVGPSGSEKLGCCSQMAIFYRKDMKTSPVEPIGSIPYKLLRRVSFPYENLSDNTIRERTTFDKLRQFISEASSSGKFTVGDKLEIPLETILQSVSDCCSTTDELENIAGKLYQIKKNETGERFLVRASSEISSDDYIVDSDSFSDLSEQEYNLIENTPNESNDEKDWSPSNGMSFGETKFCYSTPMTKNIERNTYENDVDSFMDTVFSNSDLYKTAVDYIKSEEIKDVEISSSFNGSINVGECKLYENFIEGRNNSVINKEDIIEAENTLMCDLDSHGCSIDDDKENDNIFYDNTVIQNISDTSLKSNFSSGTTHEFHLKNNNGTINEKDEESDDQVSVFLNRTLLDESGYTEKILNTD